MTLQKKKRRLGESCRSGMPHSSPLAYSCGAPAIGTDGRVFTYSLLAYSCWAGGAAMMGRYLLVCEGAGHVWRRGYIKELGACCSCWGFRPSRSETPVTRLPLRKLELFCPSLSLSSPLLIFISKYREGFF